MLGVSIDTVNSYLDLHIRASKDLALRERIVEVEKWVSSCYKKSRFLTKAD